jgi:hypothetical protein
VTDKQESGPLGLRWCYLRPYGQGDKYSVDLYREGRHTDTAHFVTKAEGVPDWAQGNSGCSLYFDRQELDDLIGELIWVRDNWGKVGRG